MPYYVEVPLGDEYVLAEVTNQIDDVMPAANAKDVVGRLPGSLGAGLKKIGDFASETLTQLRDLPVAPDVVQLEFGVTLSAKTGVVVAETTGQAHLKVAVQWHRTPPAAVPDPGAPPDVSS